MIKKFLLIFIFIFSFANYSLSASSSNNGSSKIKSDYEKAVSLIKSAKKYDMKGKSDKAEKRYKKAFKLLLVSNKKKPNNPDILNYLGFTSRKLGEFEKGENYYLEGLAIEPNHVGINEYLGELYVITNRIELAKERLNVLTNCNCEEYNELKEIIEGTKKSKY